MSLHSIADVLAYVQTHPEVPPTEVFVLMVIANYANEHGANAYPSLATLQKTTHLARRTIVYALRGLEKKQLIETELVRGRTGRQTYRLLLPHTPLKKGATDASLEEEKGARDAPYQNDKGARDAPYGAGKGARDAPRTGIKPKPKEREIPERVRDISRAHEQPGAIATNGHVATNGYVAMDEALQTIKDPALREQIARMTMHLEDGGGEGH